MAKGKRSEAPAVTRAPTARVLTGFCERVALSLEAGLDLRRVLSSEVARTHGGFSEAIQQTLEAVELGDSLGEAMARRGDRFPRLLVTMAQVGETTGMLAEVFQRLAEHYRRRAAMWRSFLIGLAWPGFQLAAALGVVGVLILAAGMLGGEVDFLGLGLTGSSGLATYLGFLMAVGTILVLAYLFLQRTPPARDAVFRWVAAIPGVDGCLRRIALARVAWALHLTLNVDLDLRRVAPLVLEAADDPRFTDSSDAVVEAVGKGQPLSHAFAPTGLFPEDFLNDLAVAEETGQIAESMARLASRYEEEAERALGRLTAIVGGAIWLLVAAAIIVLIFRLFGFYLGVINEAAGV